MDEPRNARRRSGITSAAPEFPIDASSLRPPGTWLRETGGRYASINPGAAWPNKRWPPARFAAVAAALRDGTGCRRSSSGGRARRSLAREVVAASAGAAMLSPPTSDRRPRRDLARRRAVRVGDTGPAHIAAAVGTPIVGIYGPTRPARNGPWSPDDVTVSRDARLPVPPPAPLPARDDVPAGHRGR